MSPQAVLGLVLEGIKTNWWGLACPHHCTQPSVGLLGFCFLLGWISGLASTLVLVWWLSGFWCGPGSDIVRGSSVRLASRARVLASYLHEPTLLQPRRRDWTPYIPTWGYPGHCAGPYLFCWCCCWPVGLHLSLPGLCTVGSVGSLLRGCVFCGWVCAEFPS